MSGMINRIAVYVHLKISFMNPKYGEIRKGDFQLATYGQNPKEKYIKEKCNRTSARKWGLRLQGKNKNKKQ